jgi:peptidyl-prolyl cis-trans isomerase D
MNYLRERMGKFLAIFIGLALFAFIVGEVVRSGGSFFRGDSNEIGTIDGEKISYSDFKAREEQNEANLKQQYGQIVPQMLPNIEDNTWNQLISQSLLRKEVDKLGLTVGGNEMQDMISGSNPDPQIQRQFSDQQTGQFDRGKLQQFLSYLQSAKADTTQKNSWAMFMSQVVENKKYEKYTSLVSNALYVNSLDAKDDYDAKNKLANFKYVSLPYASIPDNKVAVTDNDYQDYYNEHKSEFKNKQELRSFDYVSINAAPSKSDSAAIKADLEKLIPEFKTETNDSTFVQIHADSKSPLTYQQKGKIEPKLDSIMFSAANGFVYGPYLSNGSYKIAKLVDSKYGPDSVKARHILLNPATEGGLERAVAKADSLKKLIEGGKSFADLASMYSTDKGSAVKGGELGTFGRGAMIPAFNEAVFNGKKGDLKIVTTQYGVHLIQIEDQKGSSKVVKVAIVDKPLTASTSTQSTAYSKAQGFLANLSGGNFAAEAKKDGLPVKQANDLNGIAASAPGLDNAREIVRWAFKAKVGDFSDQVYTVGDQYVVATLTAIKPTGTLPLDAVRKQIETAVRNKVKARQLSEKLESAASGSSTIEQLASKAGVKVTPLDNIVFANPVIPAVATEYKVVGVVFGSRPGKLSKPIEGTAGVYVVVVNGFVNPAPLNNAVRIKQQIGQALIQRTQSQGSIFEALKDGAIVKDYRAKFL